MDLTALKAASPETAIYKTVGRRGLRLYLFRPPNGAGKPAPAVLFFHGGGWERETPAMLFPHAAYAASVGAWGICVEYRLTDGKTLSVRDCLRDCADAAVFVKERAAEWGIDPARLAAFGDSAGAYLAAALGCAAIAERFIGMREPLVRRVAYLNGIADLTGKWSFGLFPGGLDVERGPEKWREKFAEAYALSPLYNASAGDAETLIWQGLQDTVTEPHTAAVYRNALRAAGAKAELNLLPEAGHAFILFGLSHPNEACADVLEGIFRRLGRD
ncbi:MAG: alpha/beta hydrolase [Clostridiales bacterium]|jgi:acetyl esterase/lipase|nr:alpha/beta hydrolase [Clostridiales bacterium]